MIGYGASANLALAVPALPTINTNNVITITNSPYNATNDTTDNTTAIQNAINAAATGGNTNGFYGGTVRIPAPGTPGAFLCGPLTFKNNVNLQIDTHATLAMLPYGTYPGGTSPSDFITCSSITNVEISGSGTIDGQATATGWWSGLSTSQRPYMISLSKCQRVLIQNVTLQNPPKMHIAFKSGGGNITTIGIWARGGLKNKEVVAWAEGMFHDSGNHHQHARDFPQHRRHGFGRDQLSDPKLLHQRRR